LNRPWIAAAFRTWGVDRNHGFCPSRGWPTFLNDNRLLSSQAGDKKSGDASTAPHNEASNLRVSVDFPIPSSKARAVVGQKGSNVHSIEKETGATVIVGKAISASSAAGSADTVKVSISGSKDSVDAARLRVEKMVQSEDASNPVSPPRGNPKIHQEELMVSTNEASYIVGKGGVTLRSLQDETVSAFPNIQSPLPSTHPLTHPARYLQLWNPLCAVDCCSRCSRPDRALSPQGTYINVQRSSEPPAAGEEAKSSVLIRGSVAAVQQVPAPPFHGKCFA
jgi:hypothetical protein